MIPYAYGEGVRSNESVLVNIILVVLVRTRVSLSYTNYLEADDAEYSFKNGMYNICRKEEEKQC